MSKLTGNATIRIDGEEIPTERGATLDPGGANREVQMSGNRVFYREEKQPPRLQATALATEDLDIIALGNITGATVLFEADNGQDYLLSNAFTTETAELNSGEGQIRLNMAAESIEKI